MRNSKLIDRLNALAMKIINGKAEPMKIESLPLFQQVAALGLTNIYGLTIQGFMSRETCKRIKFNILSNLRTIETRWVFVRKIHDNWVKRNRDFSARSCELTRALAEKTDAEKVLKLAMQLLDDMTREDIYQKMFCRAMEDKDFKRKVHAIGRENVDRWMQRFGSEVPYLELLDKFYAAVVNDGIAEIMQDLDNDILLPHAEKDIPEKTESVQQLKGLGESLERLYATKRRQ